MTKRKKAKTPPWPGPAKIVVPRPRWFYWLPADANPIQHEGDPSVEGRTYEHDLDDWSAVLTSIAVVVARAQARARRFEDDPSEVTVAESVGDEAHEDAVNWWFAGESSGVALILGDGKLTINDGRNRLWRAFSRAPHAYVRWLPVRITAFDQPELAENEPWMRSAVLDSLRKFERWAFRRPVEERTVNAPLLRDVRARIDELTPLAPDRHARLRLQASRARR